MSAARHIHHPIMPFSIAAFAATLFALGLALGTTIAVGMLFFIQVGNNFYGYRDRRALSFSCIQIFFPTKLTKVYLIHGFLVRMFLI